MHAEQLHETVIRSNDEVGACMHMTRQASAHHCWWSWKLMGSGQLEVIQTMRMLHGVSVDAAHVVFGIT